ncbi:MAG: acetyl-CoA C-acetyltransferase [Thiotrichales bacterium]|nr:MAG: acetyl-CoA C-acetyltransferase [Thiotrichales bacterium]
MNDRRDVYIVDGSRTPQLKARGKPGPFSASDLAVSAGRALLTRHRFDLGELDEVIIGCVMPSEDEANIGRVIALRLGVPQRVPAWTVQRNCASGMQSIDSAYQNIANGQADLILAGGVEAMSRAPLLYNSKMVNWMAELMQAKTFGQKLKTFTRFRLGHLKPVIALLRGLTDPVVGLNMGQTAENIAANFGITRKQMDSFAVDSHHRLAAAHTAGYLEEIEPIYDGGGKFYDHDDGVRPESSVEKLAKLRPVFDRKYGSVTAGNSAQVTDGAAMLLLASEDAVKKYQLPVLAKIVDTQWAGLDPAVMGMGPVHAMSPIMERHQLATEDIDYWEINEAFATQVLGCVEAWKDKAYCKTHLGKDQAYGEIPRERLNVDGGGVSLGHPVGASGARIVLHLAKLLQRENARRGMASLCIGGGQGGAMLIEKAENNFTQSEVA